MANKKLNYMLLGIIVVIHQIIGFIWYSPILFGQIWIDNSGRQMSQLKEANGVTPFIIAILCSLLYCVMLNKIIVMTRTKSILDGIKLATLLWMGIAFTSLAVHYSFLGLSRIIFIDAGKDLLGMIIAGGVLATTNE